MTIILQSLEQIKKLYEKEWESIKIIHDPEIKTDSFFDIYTDIMIDGK